MSDQVPRMVLARIVFVGGDATPWQAFVTAGRAKIQFRVPGEDPSRRRAIDRFEWAPIFAILNLDTVVADGDTIEVDVRTRIEI